jgi:hypothetical protein
MRILPPNNFDGYVQITARRRGNCDRGYFLGVGIEGILTGDFWEPGGSLQDGSPTVGDRWQRRRGLMVEPSMVMLVRTDWVCSSVRHF